MAKKINVKIGQKIEIDFAQVHHFHVDNSREESFCDPLSDLNFSFDNPDAFNDKPNKDKGLVRLMFDGWDESQGSMKGIPVDEFARITSQDVDEVIAKAIAERQQIIADWEADENTKGLANVAKSVWFPDGKPVDILVIGNECYRRNWAIMGVVYKRTLAPNFDGNRGYTVPVQVVTFASDLDRITSHAQENLKKDSGRSLYAPLDYLKLAVQTHKALGIEADLGRMGVLRGTRQKVFGVAVIGAKYPDVKLVERCFLPKEEEITEYKPDGFVPLQKLDPAHTRLLRDGFAYNDKERTTPIMVDDTTIHDWLANVILGNVAKSPSMTGSDFAKLKDSPCKLIQDIVAAYVANDSAFFTGFLAKYHKELNACYAEIQAKEGKAPEGWTSAETSVSEATSEAPSEAPSEATSEAPSEATSEATSKKSKAKA